MSHDDVYNTKTMNLIRAIILTIKEIRGDFDNGKENTFYA